MSVLIGLSSSPESVPLASPFVQFVWFTRLHSTPQPRYKNTSSPPNFLPDPLPDSIYVSPLQPTLVTERGEDSRVFVTTTTVNRYFLTDYVTPEPPGTSSVNPRSSFFLRTSLLLVRPFFLLCLLLTSRLQSLQTSFSPEDRVSRTGIVLGRGRTLACGVLKVLILYEFTTCRLA